MRASILSGLGVALVCCALGGCQISLVAGYDDTFDQEITTAQKDVDTLMSNIAANPTQPYSSFQAGYATVETDMDAMSVRAASLSNNTDTIASLNKLEHTFSEFQTEHSQASAAAPMNKAHATDELAIMNTEFEILMRQELAKKSGQTQNQGS
jgi:hypothetical protein